MEDNKLLQKIKQIMWIIFLIVILIEVGYWIYLYKTSDEVECNLVWCKFTSTEVEVSRTCLINGIEVNCSDEARFTYANMTEFYPEHVLK